MVDRGRRMYAAGYTIRHICHIIKGLAAPFLTVDLLRILASSRVRAVQKHNPAIGWRESLLPCVAADALGPRWRIAWCCYDCARVECQANGTDRRYRYLLGDPAVAIMDVAAHE